MYETGPQVLSPVRKPNQVDTVTWNVTIARYAYVRFFLFKIARSQSPYVYVYNFRTPFLWRIKEERSQAVAIFLLKFSAAQFMLRSCVPIMHGLVHNVRLGLTLLKIHGER